MRARSPCRPDACAPRHLAPCAHPARAVHRRSRLRHGAARPWVARRARWDMCRRTRAAGTAISAPKPDEEEFPYDRPRNNRKPANGGKGCVTDVGLTERVSLAADILLTPDQTIGKALQRPIPGFRPSATYSEMGCTGNFAKWVVGRFQKGLPLAPKRPGHPGRLDEFSCARIVKDVQRAHEKAANLSSKKIRAIMHEEARKTEKRRADSAGTELRVYKDPMIDETLKEWELRLHILYPVGQKAGEARQLKTKSVRNRLTVVCVVDFTLRTDVRIVSLVYNADISGWTMPHDPLAADERAGYIPDAAHRTGDLPVVATGKGKGGDMGMVIKYCPLVAMDGTLGPFLIMYYDTTRASDKDLFRVHEFPPNTIAPGGWPTYVVILSSKQPTKKMWAFWRANCLMPFHRAQQEKAFKKVGWLDGEPTATADSALESPDSRRDRQDQASQRAAALAAAGGPGSPATSDAGPGPNKELEDHFRRHPAHRRLGVLLIDGESAHVDEVVERQVDLRAEMLEVIKFAPHLTGVYQPLDTSRCFALVKAIFKEWERGNKEYLQDEQLRKHILSIFKKLIPVPSGDGAGVGAAKSSRTRHMNTFVTALSMLRPILSSAFNVDNVLKGWHVAGFKVDSEGVPHMPLASVLDFVTTTRVNAKEECKLIQDFARHPDWLEAGRGRELTDAVMDLHKIPRSDAELAKQDKADPKKVRTDMPSLKTNVNERATISLTNIHTAREHERRVEDEKRRAAAAAENEKAEKKRKTEQRAADKRDAAAAAAAARREERAKHAAEKSALKKQVEAAKKLTLRAMKEARQEQAKRREEESELLGEIYVQCCQRTCGKWRKHPIDKVCTEAAMQVFNFTCKKVGSDCDADCDACGNPVCTCPADDGGSDASAGSAVDDPTARASPPQTPESRRTSGASSNARSTPSPTVMGRFRQRLSRGNRGGR